jgi:hypothetical protein
MWNPTFDGAASRARVASSAEQKLIPINALTLGSRIVAAEDKAVAAEFRAQAAEAQLYKANRELAAVEEAIRKRLL